jgi:hypothetical protein
MATRKSRQEKAMIKEKAVIKEKVGRKSTKPGNMHKAARRSGKDTFTAIESYLPAGSPERTTAGIVAAAGGALLAAALFGAGPAALAGAAGYLAFRETR